MLNISKKLKHLQKGKLTEAKADTQRLIDFAGQELADRFLVIKNKLKAPENDLYYWIKNKSVEELEQTVLAAEGTVSKTKAKRAVGEAGASVVCETEHWTVYHITTFAASQKYGQDSKWCIAYGDHYWKEYTNERGIMFYFAITKENYDPRGEDSKFAFAVFPGGNHIELYNQQDDRVPLDDMPYYNEINIPGVDLDNVTEEDEEYNGYILCANCGCEIDDFYTVLGDEYITPDGEYYCYDCFSESYFHCEGCDEACYIDDVHETVCGDAYCEACWNEYYDSDEGYAESIIFIADDKDYFDGYTPEEAKDMLQLALQAWNSFKEQGELRFSQQEIEELENGVIQTAKNAGVSLSMDDFKKVEESLNKQRGLTEQLSFAQEFKLYERLWD
jgi:hypothetical protein